jgi:hypothetical protein
MSDAKKQAILAKAGVKDNGPAIKEVSYIGGAGAKKTNESDNKELEAARKRAAARAKDRKTAMLNAMGVDTELKTDLQLQQEAQQLAIAEARAANKVTIERRELPRLLVVGGFDGVPGGEGRMRLVDAFDWETRRWEPIRMMRCKRRMCGAAVCLFPPLKVEELGEDGLAIVGDDEDEDGGSGGASSEEDSSSDEEEEAPKPRIVVFGGQKNVAIYAESYDPETNKWVPLPERPPHMKHLQRYGCCCATWRERLVCAGGQKDEFEAVDSVEVYDPALADKEHLRWKLLPSLNFKRSMLGLAVVQVRPPAHPRLTNASSVFYLLAPNSLLVSSPLVSTLAANLTCYRSCWGWRCCRTRWWWRAAQTGRTACARRRSTTRSTSAGTGCRTCASGAPGCTSARAAAFSPRLGA